VYDLADLGKRLFIPFLPIVQKPGEISLAGIHRECRSFFGGNISCQGACHFPCRIVANVPKSGGWHYCHPDSTFVIHQMSLWI
jgi:hypothetical protein